MWAATPSSTRGCAMPRASRPRTTCAAPPTTSRAPATSTCARFLSPQPLPGEADGVEQCRHRDGEQDRPPGFLLLLRKREDGGDLKGRDDDPDDGEEQPQLLPGQLGGGRRSRRERDDQLLELARVGVEAPDALGELVGRHGVVVVTPAEGFLVHRELVDRLGARLLYRQLALDGAGRFRQLVEQIGRDGEEVAAGERQDLLGLAEARAHYLGLVAVLLVIG